jgi:hypothetical protein
MLWTGWIEYSTKIGVMDQELQQESWVRERGEVPVFYPLWPHKPVYRGSNFHDASKFFE